MRSYTWSNKQEITVFKKYLEQEYKYFKKLFLQFREE